MSAWHHAISGFDAGGPSTDWWAQLASAVAGGLTFATLLTLVLTPCLLLLGANTSGWLERRAAHKERPAAEPEAAAVPVPAQ